MENKTMFDGLTNLISAFLSGFKAFFFFVIFFVIFGSIFLFLLRIGCENYPFDCFGKNVFIFYFGNNENVFKFALFSFVVGLILYGLGNLIYDFLIYAVVRTKDHWQKLFVKNNYNEAKPIVFKNPNSVDIYHYVGKRDAVKDIFDLQIKYAAIVRLLFGMVIGFIIYLVFSLAPIYYYGAPVMIFLIVLLLNKKADSEASLFQNQIKAVMKRGEWGQWYKGSSMAFDFEGRELDIVFIKTLKVIDGVECDFYQFDGDFNKDLGIIKIKAGFKTPLQKVISGVKTIEGHINGNGKLIVTQVDGNKKEYPAGKGLMVDVKIGELMQWQADAESDLTVYEICFPPYDDGRFENIE
ncbi:MAG: hypothetical protein WA093_03920 [Minisyncoccales bacterium]